MKKKNIFLIALLAIFLLTIGKVYADECSYTEKYALMQEAAKVKAKYEPFTEYIDDEECDDENGCLPLEEHYFKIYLTNISENIYLKVTNELTKEDKIYNYSDAQDGIITLEDNDATQVKNYSIKIYAASSTVCASESLANVYLTLPRYNSFSSELFCEENPDEYLCAEYVEFEDMDYAEFYNKISDKVNTFENQEKHISIFQKIINFIKNNIVWLIVGCVVVVSIVVGAKLVIRKRRAI